MKVDFKNIKEINVASMTKRKLNNKTAFSDMKECDSKIISKINRAKDIIKEVKLAQETEDRKSLSELNDYITNYSDMTFNEYKQFKLSKQKQ